MIVRSLPAAIQDLESVGDCIARDDPRRAVSFVRELRDTRLSLADMPLAFPLVPRYEGPGVRHRVQGRDQIFYRIAGEFGRIDVVHVLHGARDCAAILFP